MTVYFKKRFGKFTPVGATSDRLLVFIHGLHHRAGVLLQHVINIIVGHEIWARVFCSVYEIVGHCLCRIRNGARGMPIMSMSAQMGGAMICMMPPTMARKSLKNRIARINHTAQTKRKSLRMRNTLALETV